METRADDLKISPNQEAVIRRLIRHRLSGVLRRLDDTQDILQSAWRAVLGCPHRQEFAADENRLFGYLYRTAENKIRRRNLVHGGDGARSLLDEIPAAAIGTGSQDVLANRPGGQETPSQQAVAREVLDRLRHESHDNKRIVAEMAIDGHDAKDIAAATGLNVQHVRRMVASIRRRLSQELAE